MLPRVTGENRVKICRWGGGYRCSDQDSNRPLQEHKSESWHLPAALLHCRCVPLTVNGLSLTRHSETLVRHGRMNSAFAVTRLYGPALYCQCTAFCGPTVKILWTALGRYYCRVCNWLSNYFAGHPKCLSSSSIGCNMSPPSLPPILIRNQEPKCDGLHERCRVNCRTVLNPRTVKSQLKFAVLFLQTGTEDCAL
jgi:hypothetical protein